MKFWKKNSIKVFNFFVLRMKQVVLIILIRIFKKIKSMLLNDDTFFSFFLSNHFLNFNDQDF